MLTRGKYIMVISLFLLMRFKMPLPPLYPRYFWGSLCPWFLLGCPFGPQKWANSLHGSGFGRLRGSVSPLVLLERYYAVKLVCIFSLQSQIVSFLLYLMARKQAMEQGKRYSEKQERIPPHDYTLSRSLSLSPLPRMRYQICSFHLILVGIRSLHTYTRRIHIPAQVFIVGAVFPNVFFRDGGTIRSACGKKFGAPLIFYLVVLLYRFIRYIQIYFV